MPIAAKPHPIVVKHVTAYFVWAFRKIEPPFKPSPSLNLRKKYSDAAWMLLADEFNEAHWMETMGVTITQQQMDEFRNIKSVETINHIAAVITTVAGPRVNRLTGAEFPRARRN